MKQSVDRILTTHVGSLPRSSAVTDVVFGLEKGLDVPRKQFVDVIGAAVTDVVRKQASVGVDIVSDGEMSKISYATYIKDRLTGFDGDSSRDPPRDLQREPFVGIARSRQRLIHGQAGAHRQQVEPRRQWQTRSHERHQHRQRR